MAQAAAGADHGAAAHAKAEPTPTAQQLSSPRFTTRNDFSLFSRSLQRLIKPFRPRLVAPPRKAFPAGSPRIHPIPDSLTSKCIVHEEKIRDVWSYALTDKANARDSAKFEHHVYYFSGGGFQNVPSSDHWKLHAEISRRLGAEAQLHVVSYPLAPESPAADSLRILRLWLEEILSQAIDNGSSVALAGDSSGGNIAITLAIAACGGWHGLANDRESISPGSDFPDRPPGHEAASDASGDPLTMGRSKNVAALRNVFLLCPAVDMRNSNPEMQQVGRTDPILTPAFTGTVAQVWCGSQQSTSHPSAVRTLSVRTAPGRPAQLEDTDARVSPVLASLDGLAECKLRVDGLIGGHDTLSPDAKIFVAKLQDAGVEGEWQLWERMMHCWPLTWWAHVTESLEALDFMVHKFKA